MRMDSSSGKSTLRRCEICSGLHAIAHRRSCRCGLFRPFHASGQSTTTLPSGRRTPFTRRSWTYSRSLALVTNFAFFGRFAACCAFHCATSARYSCLPPRVAALVAQLAEIVPGSRSRSCGRSHACAELLWRGEARSPRVPRRTDNDLRAGEADRRHAASVTKPTGPDRHRHAHRQRRLGGGDTRRDQTPELPLHLLRRLRPPGRARIGDLPPDPHATADAHSRALRWSSCSNPPSPSLNTSIEVATTS